MSNIFKVALESSPPPSNTKVAVEGWKGAIYGFLLGNIPGAVIGHFWQEYLIQKEKDKKDLENILNELRRKNFNGNLDKEIEIKEYAKKVVEREISEIKPKVEKEKKES